MGANRAFVRRVVKFLVGESIDQFLDIGSGIPTVGNVHEIAQEMNPSARVVYVDIDPVAVRHGEGILRRRVRGRPGKSAGSGCHKKNKRCMLQLLTW
jgi:hypothetical protein